jgi:hypothetical protein
MKSGKIVLELLGGVVSGLLLGTLIIPDFSKDSKKKF